MSHVYLSLGSNLGDRYANLRRAAAMINAVMTVTAVSPVYATEPWGDTEQPPFLNACIAAKTDLTPHDVLHLVKQIESDIGRTPTRHWGPRLIDIDIVFYDRLTLDDEELTIPHPRLAERAFVLAPLADIIPDFVHPILHLTVEEMLDRVGMAGVEKMFEMPFPTGEGQTDRQGAAATS